MTVAQSRRRPPMLQRKPDGLMVFQTGEVAMRATGHDWMYTLIVNIQ